MSEIEINLSFNLNPQAEIILKVLESCFEDIENLQVNAYPLYNGRERGIVLVCTREYNSPAFHVFFAESRNSDSIVVYQWESARTFNPPTVNDIPNEAWDKPHFEPYGNFIQTADYICKVISDW